MSRFFSQKYKDLIPYTPGEQPKDQKYIKLNTNESPFAPPEDVVKAACESASSLQLYSDPTCSRFISKLSEVYGVPSENIIAANGSDETLYFSFLAFCDAEHPAAFADITYGFYPVFAEFTGTPYTEIPLMDDFTINVDDYIGINKTIFIANPNAPTGICLPRAEIERILKGNPDNVVIIDEAYVDFGGESCLPLIEKYDNLLVVRTFSKSRSLAGGRLGFAFGSATLINDLNTIRFSTNPYNVNAMTLACGIASLNNEAYTKANCQTIMETRAYTVEKLKSLGFTATTSCTNFIFVRHPDLDGEWLYLELKRRGILIRHFSKNRICQYNRITIGTKEQMDALITEIADILKEKGNNHENS